MFASTQQSDLNFSGWHALKEVCSSIALKSPNLINATNNRHRVSTLYAALDIPDHERKLFYSHKRLSKPARIDGNNKNRKTTPKIFGGE